MTAFRLAFVGSVVWLLALAAAGCACPCPPAPVSGVYSAPAPATARSSSRTESYYDRYREERHRREVEKELRDIKRNTQGSRRER